MILIPNTELSFPHITFCCRRRRSRKRDGNLAVAAGGKFSQAQAMNHNSNRFCMLAAERVSSSHNIITTTTPVVIVSVIPVCLSVRLLVCADKGEEERKKGELFSFPFV